MEIVTARTDPNILVYHDVFSKELCEEIIAWGKDRLVPAMVISKDTALGIVNADHRNASFVDYAGIKNTDIPHFEYIVDTVSKLTGFDKDRFESPMLTNYKEGQEFKVHQDYFIETNDSDNSEFTKNHTKRCSAGGNRLHTLIIYLNDVEDGGETFFPLLTCLIKPKTGKICQFDYNYDDPNINVRTQHSSLPVLKGEKWIITIWVREKSCKEQVVDFKKFEVESKYYFNIRDVSYKLECGPDWDRRTLSLVLPKNDHPMNGIAVGVTGGIESSFLLYLIAILNSFQKIPYAILPVMVASDIKDGVPIVSEHEAGVRWLISIINKKLAPIYVRNLVKLVPDHFRSDKNISGYNKVFSKYSKENEFVRFANYKYLYLGDNELPNDLDPRWKSIPFKRKKSQDHRFVQPFFNLQKYHIIDAIIQLRLEQIFEVVGRCDRNHSTLTENCEFFACNERRWGFDKLGQVTLGHKYFTIGEIKND